MQVLVTGGTGFIGYHVLRVLRAQGHVVRCLVRSRVPEGVTAACGDVTVPSTLEGIMDGCDAVIHLVGIIDEFPDRGITYEALHVEATRNVVREAVQAGVERFVHMSANGAAHDGVSRYQTTKWRSEELVRGAGFRHWTILRPGIIFGEPAPGTIEFCTRLARELILPLPVIPLFSKGQYLLQPVSVQEVAAALVQGLTLPAAHGRAVVAVGQERMAFREVVNRITLGLGRRPRPEVSIPVGLMRQVLRGLGPLGVLPVSLDQFEMLIRGNTGDATPFYELFDLMPKAFTPQNLAYLKHRA